MPFCENVMDCQLFNRESTRCHSNNESCFKHKDDTTRMELPPFLGVVCKDCGKPFLIWKTEFEGVKCGDEDFDDYLTEGHKVKVIPSGVVKDMALWCDCKK